MTRPIPVSLRPALAFLLPLLGSRKDAEALGAAREVDRKLRAAGLDWCDLAAVLAPPAPPPAPPRPPSQPKPPPPAKSAKALAWKPPVYPVLTSEERAAIREQLAEAFEDVHGRLRPWEKEHIEMVFDRLIDGAKPPTDRMLERIEFIVHKALRAAS